MRIENASVADHGSLSGGYRVLTFRSPGIAAEALPGQFVHLKVARDDCVLRRPFSVFRVREAGTLQILYKPVGRGTEAMTRLSVGDGVSLLGPLGQGFPLETPQGHAVLIAGGYGVAPLLFLAERLKTRGDVFLGGRTMTDLLCEKEFRDLGWGVHVATEDGSTGLRGLVLDALEAWLTGRGGGTDTEWFACGPDGMLRAVGQRAVTLGVRAWLSLDRRMGCGVGACLSCVQRVRTPNGGSRWARVCREGPVFEARDLVWEE